MPQNMLKLSGSFHDEGNHARRRQPSRTCTWLGRQRAGRRRPRGPRPPPGRASFPLAGSAAGWPASFPPGGVRRGPREEGATLRLSSAMRWCLLIDWAPGRACRLLLGRVMVPSHRKHRPFSSPARSDQNQRLHGRKPLSGAGLTSISCGMFSETSPNIYPKESVRVSRETRRQCIKCDMRNS